MTHNETSAAWRTFMAADDAECLAMIRELLSFCPRTISKTRRARPAPIPSTAPTTTLDTIVPDESNQPYDMKDVIHAVVDDGYFFEVQEHCAKNIVVGFARLDGQVRRHRRESARRSGRMPRHQCVDEGRALRALLRCFNIPIVTFEDVPGFLPGTEQEYGGIIRHGAKLLYAFAEATVPKITVITRKAYGGAYCVMGSKHIRTDVNFAWPTAEIAVMGPEGAVNIVYRRELETAPRIAEAVRKQKIEEFRERLRQSLCRCRARVRRCGHSAARDAQEVDSGAGDAGD